MSEVETETVVIVDGKKFYSVTSFVNEFKAKENLTGFKQLMVYFDVDEMFVWFLLHFQNQILNIVEKCSLLFFLKP